MQKLYYVEQRGILWRVCGAAAKMKLGGSLSGISKCLVLLQFVVLGSATSASGVGLFSGRPGTQSVKDFEDRLLAA
jgi:hypothetical protein